MDTLENSAAPIVIYQTADGSIATEVKLQGETVWLSQKQMAELFDKNIRTVNAHIHNIFNEGELDEPSVIRNFRITAADGKNYETTHYNLDVIISVGYRVKSKQGTQFRIWANRVLKDYLVQGYALNTQRLQTQQEQIKQLERTLRKLCKRPITVMPAKAGIQNRANLSDVFKSWFPAFAGMTSICRYPLTAFQKSLANQASLPETRDLDRAPPFNKGRLGGIYVNMLARHAL